MKILITGSSGFISGYLIEELLKYNHTIVGIDNYSKYGNMKKSYDKHPNYKFIKGDVKDDELLKYLVKESQTPKGLNEQGLREMSKRGAYKSVVNALNKIYKRLNK